MDEVLSLLFYLVIEIISRTGYAGITVLMALESACIPIPSEIIMPFAGYLVITERFSLWAVVLAGTIGNLLGSVAAYLAGYYGGRSLVEKYDKYVFVSSCELNRAQKWFEKYGNLSILFSRMLPVIRTFISLPAGIAKMPFWKFSFYTFVGSLSWSFVLAYAGVITGENWENIEIYFRKFDWLIVVLIVAAAVWWVLEKRKGKRSIPDF